MGFLWENSAFISAFWSLSVWSLTPSFGKCKALSPHKNFHGQERRNKRITRTFSKSESTVKPSNCSQFVHYRRTLHVDCMLHSKARCISNRYLRARKTFQKSSSFSPRTTAAKTTWLHASQASSSAVYSLGVGIKLSSQKMTKRLSRHSAKSWATKKFLSLARSTSKFQLHKWLKNV